MVNGPSKYTLLTELLAKFHRSQPIECCCDAFSESWNQLHQTFRPPLLAVSYI